MNMTPMIDVVFLLIIFFMTVAEFSKLDTEELELPEADQAKIQEVPPPKELVINVVKNERESTDRHQVVDLIVNKERHTRKTIEKLLRVEAELAKDRRGSVQLSVLVRADKAVEYRHIEGIIALCARFGISKLSFAATKKDA